MKSKLTHHYIWSKWKLLRDLSTLPVISKTIYLLYPVDILNDTHELLSLESISISLKTRLWCAPDTNNINGDNLKNLLRYKLATHCIHVRGVHYDFVNNLNELIIFLSTFRLISTCMHLTQKNVFEIFGIIQMHPKHS